ncbi:hypothetical protein, variant [Sphaeroforma arctica JP610]|uniref:RING-type domain-containing protein n=1 Tax=Sphaeroforma arctica JP610 TaxID=667725 RepID=A0A0L0GG47_9EUKA|nr:hypothetical protein, variant [Sphaeroforma arctica JP610]KNC87258.1 hypothetical protein, variant [Sphaeroforma arctica JP610]|eukprot:XP_014161161.1 hypothetical protein, variant [Sphaeroforma arctica JP610]
MLLFDRVCCISKWFQRRPCIICSKRCRRDVLHFCQHSYCKDCTVRWIEMVIAGDIREISCCGKVLDSSMLRNFVPSKIAAQYKRAVKLRKLGGIVCPQCLQKPISECVEPTTDSQFPSPENKLNCRLCAKSFVLPAAELDDFLALEIAAVIHGWKRCPGCTTLIEKIEVHSVLLLSIDCL